MKRTLAVIPGIAALLLGACSGLPFGPDSAFKISGTWSGRYEQLSCTLTGPDTRSCGHHQHGTVTLVLDVGATGISGTALFRSDEGGSVIVGTLVTDAPLPVTGTFDGATLSLAGSDLTPTPVGAHESILHEWKTTVDADDEFNGAAAWTGTTTASGTVTNSKRVYRLSGIRKR